MDLTEIELIPIAKNEEINDGVQIVESQHNKFLKELFWDDFSVYDYIDSLKSEIQVHQDAYIELNEKYATLLAKQILEEKKSFLQRAFKR